MHHDEWAVALMINGTTIPQTTHETPLRTKLYPPTMRSERVLRPHLLARLEQCLTHKLVSICAPAGSGKTTLLCEWLNRDERSTRMHTAWLSLDDEDNDPTRFWIYFIAALETLGLGLGSRALGLLRSTQRTPIELILNLLINEVAAVRDDIVLILDDYHVIDSPTVHAALTFFLEHQPPRMHVLIASRSEPPLSLARLRANEQLIQFDASALRFDEEETRIFFKNVMHIDLSVEALQSLTQRSEGWIAGLQMAALALRASHAQNAETFVAEFSGHDRYIADYLVEEVLQRQSARVREFLLHTSIFDRFNADLCNAVMGWKALDDAQTMLETIDRLNLFIVSLDRQRCWYRYHHLFADFLRRTLQRSDPARLATLHQRASVWFEQNGSLDEAIRHALIGGDAQRAARLIDCAAQARIARGEVSTIQKWLAALPEPMLRERPELSIWFAWTLALTRRLDEVEPYLVCAEETIRTRLDVLRDLTHEGVECERQYLEFKLSEVTSIRATVARYRGDLPRAIEFAQEVLRRAPRHDGTMRSVAAMNLGQAHLLNGNIDLAGQALYEAESTSRAIGHAYIHVSVLMFQARLRVIQGRLHRAADIYRHALHISEQPAATLSGAPQVGLGELYREWGQLDEAMRVLSAGIELGLCGGDFNYLRDGYIALARVQQARGCIDQALEDIQRAEQLARRSRTSQDITQVEAWRVRMWLAQGDVPAALQWAQDCPLSLDTLHDRSFYLHEVEYLTLARVYIVQGSEASLRDAERLLKRMRKAVENGERNGTLTEVLMLQARAAHAQGKRIIASEALHSAMALAEPEGYVRLFVDEGPAMHELLQQVAAQGTSDNYAMRLLQVFGAIEPVQVEVLANGQVYGAASITRQTTVVEALSARELDILRHLALGLSSREIAQTLLIAVSTVRWHTKNIYGKLGVRNRTEAALAARGYVDGTR